MIEKITEMGMNYIKIACCKSGTNEDILTKYEHNMLKNTDIPGLIPVSRQLCEEGIVYLYPISSYTILEGKWKNQELDMETFLDFFRQLNELYETLQKYLLDINALNLSPDYIFYDEKNRKYMFLMGVEDRESGGEKFEKLLTFFTDICSVKEQKLLEFIFELYGNLYRDNFEAYSFVKNIVGYKDMRAPDEIQLSPDMEEADFGKDQGDISEEKEPSLNEADYGFEKKKDLCLYLLCAGCLSAAVFLGFFWEYQFEYSVISIVLSVLAVGLNSFQFYKRIRQNRQ